jgi:hypothetical protein
MATSVRYWVSLVGMLCVLLHAALVARHNQSVFVAAFSDQFLSDISVLCGDVNLGDADTSDTPGPNKTASKCQICVGAAPAVAVLDAVMPVLATSSPVAITATFTPELFAPSAMVALPPSRAPPALV